MQFSQGKLLISVDRFRTGQPEQLAAARLNANGSADTGFGDLGVASATLPNAGGEALAVQDDGRIVVAGLARPGSVDQFGVVRLLSA